MGLKTPDKIRTFQRKLYLKAKAVGIRCPREASIGSHRKEFSVNWAYSCLGR
jgi:hypothetical protein